MLNEIQMDVFKHILFTMALISAVTVSAQAEEISRLQSPDRLNEIAVFLTDQGRLVYRTERRGQILLDDSPMGLQCEQSHFTEKLSLHEKGPKDIRRERYQLLVGNHLRVDRSLAAQSLTFKNADGAAIRLDLVAANDGFGFRYVFDDGDAPYTVTREVTGFQVPPAAAGWMQPYHAAGPYTPAYEDFYYPVTPGHNPPVSRGQPRGWCLPGLFNLQKAAAWILIAESDVDGGYCASHLEEAADTNGLYQIRFAYADEVTGAKKFDADAKTTSVLARKTPWRVIVTADDAAGIFNSTLITDLAEPCQVQDTSWIKPGRASWSWWSHPDKEDTEELYNSFTKLAVDFEWEYTLFDAGWWNVDIDKICRYAQDKGVMPLLWMHANDFYDTARRQRKLDEAAARGIKGVKVDFWCSDRQETMAAIEALLRDAADRKLAVVLHGCTIPRGWHRTWPNLLSAEGVLGSESYFYESRYPGKTAQQNTLLPFTRNLLSPMDTTPVGLTIRKFPRKTTAAHELAAAIIFNSGIIHYADSVQVYNTLPNAVKQVLKDAPAAWDQTICLAAEPGKIIVVARRTGSQWFVAGLNGTEQPLPVTVDLKNLEEFTAGRLIIEGNDPLMQFSVQPISSALWERDIPPFGGFVLFETDGSDNSKRKK